MQSAADDALIAYTDIQDWASNEFRRNGLAQLWRGREAYPTAYLCSTFWKQLDATSDPRQFVFGRCYDESSANNPFGRVDLTEEMQNTEAAKFQPCNPGYFWYSNGTWPEGYWSKLTNKWQDKATRSAAQQHFPERRYAWSDYDIRGSGIITGGSKSPAGQETSQQVPTLPLIMRTEYAPPSISWRNSAPRLLTIRSSIPIYRLIHYLPADWMHSLPLSTPNYGFCTSTISPKDMPTGEEQTFRCCFLLPTTGQ